MAVYLAVKSDISSSKAERPVLGLKKKIGRKHERYIIQWQCHTFDLELYWPGGPVRLKSNWPKEKHTGQTDKWVVRSTVSAVDFVFKQ